MILICNIYEKINDLLPHFLPYYQNLGITKFIFNIVNGKNSKIWNEMDLYTINYNCLKLESYNGNFNPDLDKKHTDIIIEKYISDYYMIADLDEFHELNDTLNNTIQYMNKNNFLYISTIMQDRITENGSIPTTIDKNISIFEQFPIKIDITHNILDGSHTKTVICAKHIKLTIGHHYPDTTFHPNNFGITHHFKWFGNVIDREFEKYKLYKNIYPWATEKLKLFEFFNKNKKLI